MSFRFILSLGAALLTTGCLQPASSRCGDLWCPAGSVCSPAHDRCVSPASLSACQGKSDGDPCDLAGAPTAICRANVCTPVVCGDGIVAGDEVCDDGNTVSCDGCSADCRSNETCGNGIVDSACGEDCDQGAANSDAPNATCRTNCRRQRCGDGIVDDKAGEDCDGAPTTTANCATYGFYGGTLGCSAACRNDTSSCAGECGDGVVNGPELCDAAPPGGQTCLDYGYDVGELRCSSLCTPSFAGCERMGWNPMNLTVSSFLSAVWGTAPNNVYAVGDGGLLLHYDGSEWKKVATGSTESFLSIWGSSSKDVFIGTDQGDIMHFDGTKWTSLPTGLPAGTSVWTVWGTASNNVYAAGTSGSMVHWNGSNWSSVNPGVNNANTIWSVWGSGASDIFAVADSGIIVHWNGTKWSSMTSGVATTESIFGVWGTSATNVWAVGTTGSLTHYNGTTWTLQTSPAPTNSLINIWGDAANDIYIVGDLGLILHWDGGSWTPMNTNTTETLNSVWGSGPNDVFAVGPATILHFAGGPTLTPMKPVQTNDLEAVWGSGPNNVFAVGDVGTIQRWNGVSWATMTSGTTAYLWSVWGSSATDVFAVGDTGTVLHYNGTAWSAQNSKTNNTLYWVWGTSATDVYAIGSSGTFVHYDGSAWKVIPTPDATALFYQVWGPAPNDIYIASSGSRVLHYDGTTVTTTALGGASDVWGLIGKNDKDILALTDTEGAYHYDGKSWQLMTFSSSQALDYGSGTTTDAFIINWAATGILHYDGIDFALVRTPAGTTPIYAVWMSPTVGYIVGGAGHVLRLDRHCTATETSCSNRWDDDCDGLTNCADPDCTGDPYCANGGLCSTLQTLTCGASISAANTPGQPTLERYSCSPRLENGREIHYRFTAPKTGNVTVTLSGMSGGDLDLIVLGGGVTGGCDPLGQCIGASATTNATETVTFAATAGQTYYLVVDGYQGAESGYSLAVGCN
jgi:cysteine-rich repeat protein